MLSQGTLKALLRKFGSFISDFDADGTAMSLWKGSVSLRNVRLRPGAFDRAAMLGLAGSCPPLPHLSRHTANRCPPVSPGPIVLLRYSDMVAWMGRRARFLSCIRASLRHPSGTPCSHIGRG